MNKLKKYIHKIFRLSGYDFLRYSHENFVSLRRRKILEDNQIDLVLDVGASEGKYVLDLRENGYFGKIISFEPLKQSFKILNEKAMCDPNWICKNIAIGDVEGEIDINVSGRITSSSILLINQKHVDAMPYSKTISKEEIEVVRLDSLFNSIIEPKDRIYLKADVQGYEKHVLQGATKTLKQVRAIELELSVIMLYEGAPILIEMLEFMEELDYELVSIEQVFSDPKTGYMLQADGIFIKRD